MGQAGREAGEARAPMRASLAIALLAHAGVAALVMWLVSTSGTACSGADTFSHLFAGQSLLDGLSQGSLWPLVEPLWYNGAQLMRVTGPVFAYAIAACEALAGGVVGGYVVFCGLVYLAGALGWLWVGRRLERPWLAIAAGALWFALPANLTALFVEGDLARSLGLALLPWLVGALDAFLARGGARRLAGVGAAFALLVLTDVGAASFAGIGVIVFSVRRGVSDGHWARVCEALLACVLGLAACGAWLVPFVAGGGLADMAQVPEQGLGSALASLSWLVGPMSGICLGFAASALIAFGLLCARRESRPAFAAAALLVLLTAATLQPVVRALTCLSRAGSLGLVSVALALALLALLHWRSLRVPVLVTVLALLAVDAAPSWTLVCGAHNGASVQERLGRHAQDTLVDQARAITTQRLALVDEGGLDAESAFLATGAANPVAIAQGANARAAVAKNYEQLDRALEEGRFGYLFDRSLELGCDSVIVRTSLVRDRADDIPVRIDSAAGQSGYALVAENGDYRLYHRDVDGSFGVQTNYEAIAIGSGAGQIALQFPSVEETSDACLDHYTADELASYKVVYLDGFTYADRQSAEGLIQDVAARGTRVVVLADGMPSDEHTGETSFLGVSAQPITFHGGFPELSTRLGELSCQLFPAGHEHWQTVYLNGLDDVWGSVDEDGRSLAFYGSVCGGNVVFVGLNLTYFEAVTGDAGVAALLADSLALDPAALPTRTLVPVSVHMRADNLMVTTDGDDVDTTLAWQDGFASADGASQRNGLLHVDAGATSLSPERPWLAPGVAVSVAGVAAGALALLALARREKAREVDERGV